MKRDTFTETELVATFGEALAIHVGKTKINKIYEMLQITNGELGTFGKSEFAHLYNKQEIRPILYQFHNEWKSKKNKTEKYQYCFQLFSALRSLQSIADKI